MSTKFFRFFLCLCLLGIGSSSCSTNENNEPDSPNEQINSSTVNGELDSDGNIVGAGLKFSITSLAEKECCVDGFSSDINQNKYFGGLDIPSFLHYKEATYKVISVGDEAFSGCKGITWLKLPNTIKSVGKESFANCGITTIDFGSNLQSIGYRAFSGIAIESLLLPASVCQIEYGAFCNCYNLKQANLSDTQIANMNYTFSNCHNLVEAKLPNTVTDLEGTFLNCYILKDFSIPPSVRGIHNLSFTNCTQMECINLENIYCLGNLAFFGCTSLKDIGCLSNIQAMCDLAFYGCKELQQIQYGIHLDQIGTGTFLGCEKLEKIKFASVRAPYVFADPSREYTKFDRFGSNDADLWDIVFDYQEIQFNWYNFKVKGICVPPQTLILVPKGTKDQYFDIIKYNLVWNEPLHNSPQEWVLNYDSLIEY